MVRLTLELNVSSEQQAQAFKSYVEDWANRYGAIGKMQVHDDFGEVCKECGSPMVYDGALDTYVCHHPETDEDGVD